uniref:DNA cytosine methyltransferase n=1 Tax=Amycolatopsis sp. CA-096443 TaxID=3239919 RepID=UPI003F491233
MNAPVPGDTAHAAGDGLCFADTDGPAIGSLCTGVAGLDLGVAAVLGGRIVWTCETDPHAAAVLAARLPGVPNLGDLREVDFTRAPRVDVLTAGFPCQDISASGRRAGIVKGTRSGLWTDILEAIGHLGPALVVVENVEALRWRNGGLDVVLGGLAEAGYDAVWRSVRAADIGAAHRRERVFLCAVPGAQRSADAAHPGGARRGPARSVRPRAAPRGRAPGQPGRRRQRGHAARTGPAAADGLATADDADRATRPARSARVHGTGGPGPERPRR